MVRVFPSFMTFVFTNGVLDVAGAVPSGTPPFDIVAVVLLGNEKFLSSPQTIVTEPSTVSIMSMEQAVSACPYVTVNFIITRSNLCGWLQAKATLSNGSALPEFLSFALSPGADLSASTLTVFGSVPAGTPAFRVVASASTGFVPWASSLSVTITRLEMALLANVSILAEHTGLAGRDGVSSVNASASHAGLEQISLVTYYGGSLRDSQHRNRYNW